MLRGILIAGAALVALPMAAQADAGLNVVVILDNSGSMNERMRGGGTRIEAAKRSLLTVLDQTPADASVGVLLLNPPRRDDYWLVPLGPSDPATTAAAIRQIRAGGPTPLGGALKMAADALIGARETNRYGVYKVLVVSDGEATDPALLQRFLPEVQARGVLMDVIGVDMGQQHSLAARANTYRNAADPASLEQAISEVVLGESATDSGDAGESDFELLAAIPAELAAASLTALASTPAAPIGESGFRRPPMVGGPPQPGQPPAPPPGPRAADGEESISWALVAVIVFVAMVMRAVAAANKAR